MTSYCLGPSQGDKADIGCICCRSTSLPVDQPKKTNASPLTYEATPSVLQYRFTPQVDDDLKVYVYVKMIDVVPSEWPFALSLVEVSLSKAI